MFKFLIFIFFLAKSTKNLNFSQTKLYSEAIELMCGGSPIGRVLVERKAQHRGQWEQQHHRTCLYHLFVHICVQSWGKSMETICSSHFPLYRDLPLYKVHPIGRAATGEPTLLEMGRFGECPRHVSQLHGTFVCQMLSSVPAENGHSWLNLHSIGF